MITLKGLRRYHVEDRGPSGVQEDEVLSVSNAMTMVEGVWNAGDGDIVFTAEHEEG